MLDLVISFHHKLNRFALYRSYIDRLLTAGKPYRCICSKERLEALREQQAEQRAAYDLLRAA